jgi:hypothetical protein
MEDEPCDDDDEHDDIYQFLFMGQCQWIAQWCSCLCQYDIIHATIDIFDINENYSMHIMSKISVK